MTTFSTRIGNLFETGLLLAVAVVCTAPILSMVV